jgi:hypothetical protein
MPAKPALHGGADADQVLPVVDQLLDLPAGVGVLGPRQIRLAQGGPGDGQGVDRIGLAAGAGAGARQRHQLRRHPDHDGRGIQQGPLQPARHVPTVLHGELDPIRGEGPPGPAQQLPMPGVSRAHRDRPLQLPTRLVHGYRAVRALVDVDPDHDHHEKVSSLSRGGRLGRPADTPQWGRCHAPIKSRRSALTSGDRHNACSPAPQSGTEPTSQITTGQDPQPPQLRRSAP